MITQSRSKRTSSGGRYKAMRKKRFFDRGRHPSLTKIGKTSILKLKGRSLNFKERLLVAETANVFDKKTGKYTKSKIKTVVDSPANRHYARRNILVKGTVVETELGKAKITSRPGQSGSVNAVLI